VPHPPLRRFQRLLKGAGHFFLALRRLIFWLQNDLGLKASDMALATGHAGVQHYLNLFEASLCVAGDLAVVQNNFEALRAENSELKGYFRLVPLYIFFLTKLKQHLLYCTVQLYLNLSRFISHLKFWIEKNQIVINGTDLKKNKKRNFINKNPILFLVSSYVTVK